MKFFLRADGLQDEIEPLPHGAGVYSQALSMVCCYEAEEFKAA